MWGARARRSNRKVPAKAHTFENVRDNVKTMTTTIQRDCRVRKRELETALTSAKKRKLSFDGSDYRTIHDRKSCDRQILLLSTELQKTEVNTMLQAFAEKANPLVVKGVKSSVMAKQQRHALYLSLFGQISVPCYVNRDICHKCNSELVRSVDSKVNCTQCGLSTENIYCMTEYTHITPAEKHNYKRDQLYLKYLMQYHESVKEMPDYILNLVYKQLSKVHLMLRARTKPTPIAQILRDAGHQRFVMYAPRIAKTINNEPIPVLSQAVIDRLLFRCKHIIAAFGKIKNNCGRKIINFEFLTKHLLLMDDETRLARMFYCHKTRTVLNKSQIRLAKCCKILEAENLGLSWKVKRMC